MKLIRNSFAFGVIAAALVAACSSQQGTAGNGGGGSGTTPVAALNGENGNTGSVNQNLTIANGVNLYSLNYTCTGPGTIPSGTVNFNDAQSVEFVLGGIPAGTGYTCTLSGTDSAGDLCTGSTSFTVAAGQVLGGGINVTCTVATDAAVAADVNNGSYGFDASVMYVNQGAYACPGINSFSILPSEVIGTQPAQLGLSEVGPIGLSSTGAATTSNIIWSASCATPPCGNFLGADGGVSTNSANPSFVCGPNAEVVSITAQVTNYETNVSTAVTSDVCAGKPFTTISASVNCEGGGSIACFAPTNTVCGTTCTNTSNAPVDPANCGACGVTCSGATPICTHNSTTNTNACAAAPPGGPCTQLVGGVPADATGNTTCVQCDQNTNKLCSNTEAIIVTRDQEKGLINAAGTAPSAASCYECAVTAGAIDSTVQGFSGEECDDLTGTAVQLCLNAYNCYVGSPQSGTPGVGGTNAGDSSASLTADCTNEAPAGVFNCFCGSNEPDVTDCKNGGTVAAMASGGLGVASPNGACISQTIAGTGTTTSTINATIIGDLSNTALGAGQAAQTLQLFGSNNTNQATASCPVCYK